MERFETDDGSDRSDGGATEAEESSLFAPGDVLQARFRVEELIGRGGMSEVYRVWDARDGEMRALKVVIPDLFGSAKAVERFAREIRWTQRIDHRNVVDIKEYFDLERDDAKVPCLVMELLQGESLVDHLERHGRMSCADARPIICQMAAALDAAHRAGIVHRDLKPANVLLQPTEPGEPPRVVLTDFGVARENKGSDLRDDSQSLTASNVILGTPDYLAPEQLELEEALPASDFYALGLVFYQMVTGVLPFQGDTPLEAVFQRVQQPAPSPRRHVPDLDPACERVILRCLKRDPAERYPHGAALIRDLDGDTSGYLEAPPRRIGVGTEIWVTVGTIVVLLLLAALVAWFYV